WFPGGGMRPPTGIHQPLKPKANHENRISRLRGSRPGLCNPPPQRGTKLPDWEGRILIDATNHFLLPSMELADLGGRVSSEIVSELAPSAKVVKALNTLYASNLARDPKVGNGRRVIYVSGDDGGAKGEVSGLLSGLGVAVIDLGSLREGRRAQQVKASAAVPLENPRRRVGLRVGPKRARTLPKPVRETAAETAMWTDRLALKFDRIPRVPLDNGQL